MLRIVLGDMRETAGISFPVQIEQVTLWIDGTGRCVGDDAIWCRVSGTLIACPALCEREMGVPVPVAASAVPGAVSMNDPAATTTVSVSILSFMRFSLLHWYGRYGHRRIGIFSSSKLDVKYHRDYLTKMRIKSRLVTPSVACKARSLVTCGFSACGGWVCFPNAFVKSLELTCEDFVRRLRRAIRAG